MDNENWAAWIQAELEQLAVGRSKYRRSCEVATSSGFGGMSTCFHTPVALVSFLFFVAIDVSGSAVTVTSMW